MNAHRPRSGTGEPTADTPISETGGQGTNPHLTVADGSAAAIPDDPQALAADIERTRQQVGDTVEALTAKLDVKAQLKDAAGHVKERISGARDEATGKITQKTAAARQQLRGTTKRAARTAGEQRVPLAVAAGVALLALSAWMAWLIRRR